MQYCGCCGIEVEDFGEHEKTEEHKKNLKDFFGDLDGNEDERLKTAMEHFKRLKKIVVNCPECNKIIEGKVETVDGENIYEGIYAPIVRSS
jgi:Fe-S oxidoreductase